MPVSKRKLLRDLLLKQHSILVPGVHDMISAKIASEIGFDAVYMTGYGVAASELGLPDLGLATYTDMRAALEKLVQASTAPLIADADTGYGGLLNVRHTVRGYEAAGAAGLQLEDQDSPKRCGLMDGLRLVSTEDMVRKLRVALDSRENADFTVIARTDAYASMGIDEALRRAEAYATAGADALFIEGVKHRSELEQIAANLDIPLVGVAPEDEDAAEIRFDDLVECGFRIVIFPVTPLLAATAAMYAAYKSIKLGAGGRVLPPQLHPFHDLGALMGADELMKIDKRFRSLS